jgi:hypothetical protein
MYFLEALFIMNLRYIIIYDQDHIIVLVLYLFAVSMPP